MVFVDWFSDNVTTKKAWAQKSQERPEEDYKGLDTRIQEIQKGYSRGLDTRIQEIQKGLSKAWIERVQEIPEDILWKDDETIPVLRQELVKNSSRTRQELAKNSPGTC
ncbi:hypothetical protein Bbelb_027300 [Branchiostoma belcheri]|nr:hypothetical protein Bbelb_027300 [Branchiostoma belcheri]